MSIESNRKKITNVMRAMAFFYIACSVLNIFLAINVNPLWAVNGLVCLLCGLFTLYECRAEENKVRAMELKTP